MTECYVNILHLKVDIPADNNNVYNIIIRIYYINCLFSFQNINTLTSDLHQVLRFILNILINEKLRFLQFTNLSHIHMHVYTCCKPGRSKTLGATWSDLPTTVYSSSSHTTTIHFLGYGVKFNR